ncbi:MAG TPA: tRNA (N(6)-L-threonylcarbamoyladenosine(37)-C(2))-methylthiotransferase MtaB, partial [Spirochaetia bacterium]|nr:tRNA (N(6)-L-threonylcarbamoyladenosine(37)-C(2))-methylthiotransferase MtaB [Spirochaetia bacterium]
MRIGFHTLGCKLNQYETEALASSFRAQGHTVVSGAEEADAYIVNTCTVTGRADHKSRAAVRSLSRRHPQALLIITGCSAELEGETLASLGENVLLVPQSAKGDLMSLAERITGSADIASGLAELRRGSAPAVPDPFAFRVKGGLSFHTRAFLKVQDGCDAWCAYCRVPQARGPSRSLDVDEVLRRAVELESSGHREIVITGVNISSYRSKDVELSRLVREMVGATRVARFRLSSLEPEALTQDLAESLALERVCAHFHLPVQSGSDGVLGRMKRRYRSSKVADGIALLRQAKEDPFVAADFIVGFPGETPEEHQESVRLIRSTHLAALHVFPFSPRPGTPAATLRPAVPQRVRDERAAELGRLSRALLEAYAKTWAGREAEALIEAKTARGAGDAHGVTGNYLKVSVHHVPAEV